MTWTTSLQCVPVLHLSYLFQSSKDRPLPLGETYGDRGLHVRKSNRFLHISPAGIVPKAGAKVEPLHHIRKYFTKFFQEKTHTKTQQNANQLFTTKNKWSNYFEEAVLPAIFMLYNIKSDTSNISYETQNFPFSPHVLHST